MRWREAAGSVNRQRTFDHEDDARDFDRRLRRLKQTGDPAVLADEITLRDYVHGEWWPNYAERRLAGSTQQSHAIDLDLRILPRLGDLPLSRVRPAAVERFIADLERAGTGRATIVSTLSVLQGVMKRAARDYNLSGNPVSQVDKPSQRREREPVLVSVEQVEAMRAWFLARGDRRSAVLIALLAYAGPRPESEALPLTLDRRARRTILFRATKRGALAERATRLLAPLAEDLRAWRARLRDRPRDESPVIPNATRPTLGRARLGQLARTRLPRGGGGRRTAGGQGGRAAARPPARPALELRDAADLRRPATALRRRTTRPQRRHPAARLRPRLEEFDPARRISAEEQIRRARGRIARRGSRRRGDEPPPRSHSS